MEIYDSDLSEKRAVFSDTSSRTPIHQTRRASARLFRGHALDVVGADELIGPPDYSTNPFTDFHGMYAGKDKTGGKIGKWNSDTRENFRIKPTDTVDALAMQHDFDYATMEHSVADRKFVRALYQHAVSDPSLSHITRLKAYLAALGFEVKIQTDRALGYILPFQDVTVSLPEAEEMPRESVDSTS